MQTNTTKFFILALLIILSATYQSCKKDEENSPPYGPKGINILSPSDSSYVQIGTIQHFTAEVYFFDEDPALLLSIDTLNLQKKIGPPYDFFWDTEGWPEEMHTIRIHTESVDPEVFDEITIILIDTIQPLEAPVAVINVSPSTGNTDSVYVYDASASYDPDGNDDELLYRWDFDGDDLWDTEFTQENLFMHSYSHPGNYLVKLEVMDADSLSSDTVISLHVSHSGTTNACEGYVSIPYGGKVYHMIAIGNQCWLRENMDIGVMIAEGTEPANNQVIEKYCYEDDSLNCDIYGGLYKWDELMNYMPLPGARGICPSGWHIPSDMEWKELEGFVDSQYEVGNDVWDEIDFRGFDAAKHLKSLLGWTGGGFGDNLYDFKALAAGSWRAGYGFNGLGEEARFWTATHDSGDNAFHRLLQANHNDIFRDLNWDSAAFSVRCIKD